MKYTLPTLEEFNAMSPAQKRVAIATDVLAILGTITPITGLFLIYPRENLEPLNAAELHRKFRESVEGCRVCALGATVLATVRLGSKATGQSIETAYSESAFCESVLGSYFNLDQLRLIEQHYEGWRLGWHTAKKYPDNNERLAYIMQNIVANGGEFKPDA